MIFDQLADTYQTDLMNAQFPHTTQLKCHESQLFTLSLKKQEFSVFEGSIYPIKATVWII